MVLEWSRPPPSATLLGIPMKQVSLVAVSKLQVQIVCDALILSMHYSRVMPLVDGRRYLPSTAVLMAELLKLALSLIITLNEASIKQPSLSASELLNTLSGTIFNGDSWKLAIPASLFTLQSSLHFIAVSHLGAATFQVTNELKILTTALFSVILLGRSISLKQWTALILLTAGVAVVLVPVGNSAGDFKALRDHTHPSWWVPHTLDEWKKIGRRTAFTTKHITRSSTRQSIEDNLLLQKPHLNSTVGFVAAIIACVSSGLASVVFEKVLKDHRALSSSGGSISIWVRNIQLSLYSIIPAFLIGVLFKDGEEIAEHGFFAGYNWAVWMTIFLQAAGGIIVALVIHYANSIAKNFATSISIILSSVVSMIFFDMAMTAHYVLGTGIVIGATWLYNDQGPARSSSLLAVIKPMSKPEPMKLENIQTRSFDGPTTPRFEHSFHSPRLDIDRVGSPFKTPVIETALTTSRPTTPSQERERHHYRVASGRRTFEKRTL